MSSSPKQEKEIFSFKNVLIGSITIFIIVPVFYQLALWGNDNFLKPRNIVSELVNTAWKIEEMEFILLEDTEENRKIKNGTKEIMSVGKTTHAFGLNHYYHFKNSLSLPVISRKFFSLASYESTDVGHEFWRENERCFVIKLNYGILALFADEMYNWYQCILKKENGKMQAVAAHEREFIEYFEKNFVADDFDGDYFSLVKDYPSKTYYFEWKKGSFDLFKVEKAKN